MISGKTQVCGLIGDPVEHSVSPAMHNAAFRKLGLNYVYLPFRVRADNLGKAIAGVRAMEMRGINVTVPHKVAVIPHLDTLDDLARNIGAVNTIVNENGCLTGYNTDAEGFLRSMLQRGIEPAGMKVVIAGAGGAARAIAFALMNRGAKLSVINRTLARAEALARQVDQFFGKSLEVLELNDANLARCLDKADIVVNTTSVGMYPCVGATPVASRFLRRGIIVCDIVYNPVMTRLLEEAKQAGAVTVDGIEMLAWQGAVAFEKWTGHNAPVALMKEEAMRQLGK